MKKWMTLIELIAVLVVLATLMGVGSIKIINSQENKWAKQEITTLYNTFNTHNRNISRWKSWSKTRSMTRNSESGNIIPITNPDNEEEWIIRIITWESITFNYCSWSTILWKNIEQQWDCKTWTTIPYVSTLYICEKDDNNCNESSNKLLAEIQFYDTTNNISLIWTWKFKQIN
jgi:hypothetical protein